MKRFLRDNGLSLVLVGLFLAVWAAQAVAGYHVHSDRTVQEGGHPGTFAAYLASGHFWGATGENWESEFLQMGAYVVLTSFLFQRNSAESNDPDRAEELRRKRRSCPAGWWYRNSLSLALFGLFLGAFLLHFGAARSEFNEERRLLGLNTVSPGGFLATPEFWFQSLQNWQSEFLAVLSLVLLTIVFRQNGSPQSRPIDD